MRGLIFLAVAAGLAVPGQAQSPQPVSPGRFEGISIVAGPCPTFSWTQDGAATGFEVAVYRLEQRDGVWSSANEPVSRTWKLPAGATSLSPALDECLKPGERYAWAVRALGDEPSSWSAPALFEVPRGPELGEVANALATIERYLAAGGSLADLGEEAAGQAEPRDASPAALLGGGGTNAAIRGENTVISANAHGVAGIANSPAAAGLWAENLGNGTDLLLAGGGGNPDLALSETGARVASADAEVFAFENSGAGSLGLTLDGVAVTTTATDQDTLAGLVCANGQVAKRQAGGWVCADDQGVASDLNCVGCVGTAELDFDPATQTELDSHKVSGDHDGRYVLKAGDTISGGLVVAGDLAANSRFDARGATFLGDAPADQISFLGTVATSVDHGANAVVNVGSLVVGASSGVEPLTVIGPAGLRAAPDTRLNSLHDDSTDAIAGFVASGPGPSTPATGGFVLAAAKGASKHLSGIGDNDPYLAIRSPVHDFHIGHLVPMLTVDGGNGRVGIGDTSPAEALEVNGKVAATGFVGSGSELTGLPPASGLVCTGCVDAGHLATDSVATDEIDDGAIAFADLGQNGCGGTQVPKWNGSAWACANDEDSLSAVACGSYRVLRRSGDGLSWQCVFDREGLLDEHNWSTVTTGIGAFYLRFGYLELNRTDSGPGIGYSAVAYGNRAFDLASGDLIFRTVSNPYADGGVYGDRQPRGLVNGVDRDNAIEFASNSSTSVVARTRAAGVATETFVFFGSSVRRWRSYQIVASASEVRFYIDGALVATHTTNIPTTPLNIYFSSTHTGNGWVHNLVDWVSLERVVGGDRVLVQRDDFDRW